MDSLHRGCPFHKFAWIRQLPVGIVRGMLLTMIFQVPVDFSSVSSSQVRCSRPSMVFGVTSLSDCTLGSLYCLPMATRRSSHQDIRRHQRPWTAAEPSASEIYFCSLPGVQHKNVRNVSVGEMPIEALWGVWSRDRRAAVQHPLSGGTGRKGTSDAGSSIVSCKCHQQQQQQQQPA